MLTEDGVQNIEMGWYSEARFNAINKETAFGAAPDICIHYLIEEGINKALNRKMWLMSRAGTTENWQVYPNGKISVKKNNEFSHYLIESKHHNLFK